MVMRSLKTVQITDSRMGGRRQGSLVVVEGSVLWQEFGWVNRCINFDSLSLSQSLRERGHHLGKLRVLFAFLDENSQNCQSIRFVGSIFWGSVLGVEVNNV